MDNAGGSSYISELHSINLFQKMFNAVNYVYENDLKYKYDSKKLDYTCEIPLFYDYVKCSVSVTRVIYVDPIILLMKKLDSAMLANATLDEPSSIIFLHI